MGSAKADAKNAVQKAAQATPAPGKTPSVSGSCPNLKPQPGKICILATKQGKYSEDHAVDNLMDAYSNAEVMLIEDNPDLSCCDQLVVNAHGGKGIRFPGYKGMSDEEFIKYLKDHHYGGSEITLAVCNLGLPTDTNNDGQYDYSFASKLANDTGANVTAYPHYVTIRPGDRSDAIREAHPITIPIIGKQVDSTISTDAHPRRFEPGGKPEGIPEE